MESKIKSIMSKIFLVRHGQDTDNALGILNGWRNTELTILGYEQAKETALKLKDKNIQIIYTSPLSRACATAQIIAKELKIDEVIINDHLIERDFGILTGKPVTAIDKYSNRILPMDRINYFLEAEGAEDFPTLLERAKKILMKIKRRHPNKNVLIVTHGDTGKMLLAAHHNWTWEQGLKTAYFDNAGVLELS